MGFELFGVKITNCRRTFIILVLSILYFTYCFCHTLDPTAGMSILAGILAGANVWEKVSNVKKPD